MRTYDFWWRWYMVMIELTPGAPLIHTYEVNELSGECRTSTAVFIRLWPFRVALGFGRWSRSGMSKRDMFKRVFNSRDVELDGEIRERVRQAVGNSGLSADDEWTILEMLDLES